MPACTSRCCSIRNSRAVHWRPPPHFLAASNSSSSTALKRHRLHIFSTARSATVQKRTAPCGCLLQCGSPSRDSCITQHRSSQSAFQSNPPGQRSSSTSPWPSSGASGSLRCSSQALSSANGSGAPEASTKLSREARSTAGCTTTLSKGLSGTTKPWVESSRSLGSWQYSQVSCVPLEAATLAVRRQATSSRPGCRPCAAPPNRTRSPRGGVTSTCGSKLWLSRSRTGTISEQLATRNRRVRTSCKAHKTSLASKAWPSARCVAAVRNWRNAAASGGLRRASTSSSVKSKGKPRQGKPTCLR
mmetsp:Transcript_143170/g.399011  ORF Transcript_143170/g.399011 Transcript_143170/m.399011 type:complete len:302 (+) Transcript_143170:461-1366(+)